MARIYLRRRESVPAEPVTSGGVRRQLAWAAGSEYFQNRAPLWHVTEAFQTSFEQAGRRRAGELERRPEERENPAEQGQPSLRAFSETAFQRGSLAGAVLEGSGRMMLTSCLRRTVGQEPQTARQRTLTGLGAKTKSVPGGGTSQVMFHRGFVNSAVGLVVDVLQDARRTVDLMTRMVQGRGGVGEQEGVDTLRAMYPFLEQSREEALLAQYRRQLQQAGGVEEKALLHSAIVRTQALIEKKAQMKTEFTQKLREISDRANQALREFQEPDFVDGLMRELTEGDANASHGRPADGGGAAGAPGGGAAGAPEPAPDGGAGDAGGVGGDPAGQPPPGDGPAAGREGGQQRHAGPAGPAAAGQA